MQKTSLKPLQIMVVPVTPYQQNCLLIWDDDNKTGAVIDPGGDVPLIEEAIAKTGATFDKIYLTHAHIDHAGGARELADRLGTRIEGPHKEDQFLLDELPRIGAAMNMEHVRTFTPDAYLGEGDKVGIASVSFDVRHVPGHTPGHVVFIAEDKTFVIGGDTIFENSVGRTDFPYGNGQQLLDAIEEKLMILPDDTVLLTGHGNPTSVGAERRSNPYLKDMKRA